MRSLLRAWMRGPRSLHATRMRCHFLHPVLSGHVENPSRAFLADLRAAQRHVLRGPSLLLLGTLAGCAAHAGDSDVTCRAVVEITHDTAGASCFTPTADGTCCPDGFLFVGLNGSALVCLELR